MGKWDESYHEVALLCWRMARRARYNYRLRRFCWRVAKRWQRSVLKAA